MNEHTQFRAMRYGSRRKRAEFTAEERKFILDLLRESRESCDPVYAVRAAGFWLQQQASPELRPNA